MGKQKNFYSFAQIDQIFHWKTAICMRIICYDQQLKCSSFAIGIFCRLLLERSTQYTNGKVIFNGSECHTETL